VRKRKIKKTLISVVVGVILGVLISQVTNKLSLQDCLLLASILLILVMVTAAIMAEDLEIRIKKAYLEGKQTLNCQCTHTFKTEDE
jgi:high-affinity Fe2+/Pb2+ permease